MLTILIKYGIEPDSIKDETKPDGTPRQLMDVSKLHELGWRHQVGLRDGIEQTYAWFLANDKSYKQVKIN